MNFYMKRDIMILIHYRIKQLQKTLHSIIQGVWGDTSPKTIAIYVYLKKGCVGNVSPQKTLHSLISSKIEK